MSKLWKRIPALLLSLVMVLSMAVSAYAEGPEQNPAEVPEGSESRTLELEDLDPATLHIKKLGEIETDTQPVKADELPYALTDLVRVSIFLDEPSTLDQGYSLQHIAENEAAVSYRESLWRNQDAMQAAIEAQLGHALEVKWNLTLAANAISAVVPFGEIQRISEMDGVKSVELENRYDPQVDEASPNTSNTSSGMVGATTAWADGYSGAGSRIAIIDTGLDTTHQSFNTDAFNHSIQELGKTSELMTQISSSVLNQLNAKKKLSSLTAAQTYVSAKIPYGFNYVDGSLTINHLSDTQGEHGSHVAGIAAANRYIKSGNNYNDAASTVKAVGMAPDAQLLIMKVFGSNGGAYDSDYMVAIEDAIVLDCDSVNLSLGSGSQGFTYANSYQTIMNNLSNPEKNPGMVVTISAGNSYDITQFLQTDLYIDDVSMHTGGSPGTFINSLGTAAAQNIGVTGAPLTFNGNQTVYYTETSSSGAAMISIAGSYSYVYIDAVGTANDYSTINSAVSLSGKIVIVNRGELSFYEKGNNAKSYSPKALIVANNEPGTISMGLDDYTGTFPMVSITQADAETIKANSTSHTTGSYTYYTGTVTVTNTLSTGIVTAREDAEITDFSSWGVPGSLIMKPEITAPGGDIYSVFGTNKLKSGSTAGGSDQYELMSGTSMAAPHMVGLAAIVAQYIRENDLGSKNSALTESYSDRAIIQSLLMSTATPMKNNGKYLPILQQGAGLAEVSLAVRADSVLMIDEGELTTSTGAAKDGKVKVEFGDDPDRSGRYSYSFTLYNLTSEDLAFDLSTDLFTQDYYTEDGETFMAHTTRNLTGFTPVYAWETISDIPVETHDVNKDGLTNEEDAQAILDYLSGETAASQLNLTAADMDGDGKVSTKDAVLLLNFEGGVPSEYPDGVVPANGKRSVTVTLALTDAQKEALQSLYPSGAYIEGFTKAACTTVNGEGVSFKHEHTIPLLGFYGSWTDPSMFDNTSYVDTLYGTAKTPYTGNTNTNYMTVQYGATTSKFSGNPYKVEEDGFPASRLALNSNSKIGNIYYNLIRAAGTTGVAVSKLDHAQGDVTSVLSASVASTNVLGIWYYQSAGSWQNLGTKFTTLNKTPASYGLQEGDAFRVGFYAIPEYNAMLYNSDDMTSASAGNLGVSGMKAVIEDNVLGRGAFVGYDFTIDNIDPVISTASLNGDYLTVEVSDNLNLAYVAVLSLDGETVYAESTPGDPSYQITFDATNAIRNARGYVAVFAGDYAGNEVARAVRVNDNAYEEKTYYVLTDTLTAGEDYLIVSRNTVGSGNALSHSGTTVSTNAVTVKAANNTVNAPFIESADVASTSVWTASSGFKLMNGNYYIRRNNSTLQISATNSYNSWTWDGSNNRLYQSSGSTTYYLRYSGSSFSVNTSASSVYLFKKTVIRIEIDPYEVSSVSVLPGSLDLYKGNTADLSSKVLPLTAADRSVSWVSSNPSVATVDETGHVTAVAAGTATITATSNSDGAIFDSCSTEVTVVNKEIHGIVWDENGGVYFSKFNASSLPTWTKNHNDNKSQQLTSAFMQSTSQLYAATLDTSSAETVLYSVNRTSYSITEYGTNYLFATDMAIAASNSTYSNYVGMAYTFGPYLVGGPIKPGDDGEGGTYCGLPYAALDCSETTGDAYFAGIAVKSRASNGGTFYVLDENGIIWQSTLSLNGNSFVFSTPTKVLDTGIGSSFLYQNLYYDGTYLYWAHTADNVAELIIINPTSGVIYHAGDFGEGVWPVTGLYVNGSVAPASVEDMDETPVDPEIAAALENMMPVATREELMNAEIRARFAVEAAKMQVKQVKAPETTEDDSPEEALSDPVETEENSAADEVPEEDEVQPEAVNISTGTLNAIRGLRIRNTEAKPQAGGSSETDPEGGVTVTLSENVPVTNGMFTVSYDPDALTYVNTESTLAYKSVHVDSTQGIITFTYANKTALAANTVLAEVHFTASCDDTAITVLTKERNDDLNLSESSAIPVNGKGHAWGNPSWTWTGSDEEGYTAAAVTFTCQNDNTHKETVNAVITTETTPATCESDGQTVYTAAATFDGAAYSDSKTVVIPATGHEWGEVHYTWTQDNSQVTAERVCTKDPAHKQTETVVTEYEVTKDETCEEDGTGVYTATFTNPAFKTQTKVIVLPAIGHAWGTPTYTWASNNSQVTAERICANDPAHKQTETVVTDYEVTKDETCEEDGTGVYTATFTNPAFETQTKTIVIPASGHEYELDSWNWVGDDEHGYTAAAAKFVCAYNDSHVKTVTATVTSVTTPASCEAAGKIVYTATASFEGEEYTDTKTVVIPATGHDYEFKGWTWDGSDDTGYTAAIATFICKNDAEHENVMYVVPTTETTAGSCTEPGTVVYTATTTFEGKTYTDTKTVTGVALGHDWGEPEWTWTGSDAAGYTKATAKFTCKRDASHVENVTVNVTSVTTPATCEEAGQTVYTAKATFEGKEYTDSKTVAIPALGHDYEFTGWTWTGNDTEGYTAATVTFTCKNDASHKENVNAVVTPVTTPATCEEAGKTVYTAKATFEGKEYTDSKTVVIPATGHDYEFTGWNWTGDDEHGYTAAAVKFICAYDESHVKTITATVTSVTTPATCEEAGQTVYSAKATFEGKEYTDSKTVVIPALGHEYEFKGWTWTGNDTDGYTAATAKFVCKKNTSHEKYVNAEITKTSSDSTCTTPGTVVYTATVTFEGKTYTDTKTVTGVALGHDWGEPEWTWTGSDSEGYTAATATFTCKRDASHTETVTAVVTSETTPATCEVAGKTVYTAKATLEGKEYTSTKEVTIPATGHDYEFTGWNWTGSDAEGYTAATVTFTCKNNASHTENVNAVVTPVTTPATCEEAGKTVYTAKATFEGKEYTDSKTVVIPALGHDYELTGWTWIGNDTEGYTGATVTFTCKNDASHKKPIEATVTSETTPATCEIAGKTVYTAKATFEGKEYTDSKTVAIQALGHDYELTGWTWTGDDEHGYTAATVTFTCKNNANHKETVNAVVTSETTPATCEEAGKTVYTAKATFEGKEYTDSKTVAIKALGHDYELTGWTWIGNDAEGYTAATVTFTCKNDASHKEPINAVVTSETTPATCEEAGKTVYTATATFEGKEYTDSKTVVIPALGHDYEFKGWTWTGNDTDGYTAATAKFICKRNTEHVEEIEATLTSKSDDGSCTEPGTVVYTATVTFEGKTYTDTKTVTGVALGHDWGEPEWKWTGNDADGYTAATATFTCKRDASHTETKNAEVTKETTPATCEVAGKTVYTAKVTLDGKEYTDTKEVTIPATGHDYELTGWNWTGSDAEGYTAATVTFTCKNDASHTETVNAVVTSETTPATCEDAGKKVYTAKATFEGKEYKDSKTVVILALGHDYELTGWTWTGNDEDGYTAATVTFTCKNDNAHKEIINAVVTSEITPATCEEAGKTVYTAKATFEGKEYTDSKTVVIPALGHDYEFKGWTWTGNDTEGYTAAKASFTCKRNMEHVEEVEATLSKKSDDGSCIEPGTVVYTATVSFEGKTYTDTKTVTGVAMGHDWGEPEWTWTGSDSEGYTAATVKFTCKRDASHTETITAVVTSETTPATCEAAGKTVYTAKAAFEGKEYTDTKEVTIPALGHDWSEPEWTWTENYAAASAKFICKKDASHVKTITAAVTSEIADGKMVYTATVEFEGKTYTDTREKVLGIELDKKELVLTSKSSEKLTAKYIGTEEEAKNVVWRSSDETIVEVDETGKLTQKKAGYVTITASADGFEASCEILVLFDDVQNQKKFYYEPVYWALKNGITTGKAAYIFAPEEDCLRGHIVTFLWRLNGAPEGAPDAGFKDVKPGKWYTEAVNWAAAEGIVTGYKDSQGNLTGIFGWEDACKREDVVTILWRAAGSPKAKTDSGFTDVKPGKWYTEAINWAAENGITTGLKDSAGNPTGEFGRGRVCTRGEIVTFLYRYAHMNAD